MTDSVLIAEAQNFGNNELNIADGVQVNGGSDIQNGGAPKSKNRVQIVASSTKSEDKRPKSDATIRMRGNVLIQNPAQEWKVRSCELNGSFLTFFRKQKMVAAIDLEQVGDINVLRKINDSSGQGFIFSLHLKEGRYFNVRVSMYDDALNWVKVLVETRDKLRSHHSHHSRTRSFSAQNDHNYSSFTPLASDFNTSLLVADEPDDNIKVYFDNGQFPPSPIFEANEKYVRPLLSKASADNVGSSHSSLNSPLSPSSRRGSSAGTGAGPTVSSPVLQPRSLNDGQEGGFEQAEQDAGEVGESEEDEEVKPYDSNSFDEDQRRAEAERAMRAKLAEMEAERVAEEQAEEARLGAMIASARNARENAEKAAQAKAAREEKMREEQAARAAKIAAEKAAEEEHLAVERAAKEARFAAEQTIREKKAAAEKLARDKQAAEQAAKAEEEKKLAAERALKIVEREAAAKKKLAEQAVAAKEAEQLERQQAREAADRKADLRSYQQAERKASIVGAPGSPRSNPATPVSAPNSSRKEATPTPLSLAGSLFGQVEDTKFSQENMWRQSRNPDHQKPSYVQPELNLDGTDMTVVDSHKRHALSAGSTVPPAASATPGSPSLQRTPTKRGSATKTAELTLENVSQHTSNTASPPRTASLNNSPVKESVKEIAAPSSFDEVFDSVPAGNSAAKFRNAVNVNQTPRKVAATPERKRNNGATGRPYSLVFQVCVGVVFIAVVVLGALGCTSYYKRYQAEEVWRAESLKTIAVNTNPNARSAAEVSRPTSIGSSGLAASKTSTASRASTGAPITDTSLPRTSAPQNRGPSGLSSKPVLSSGGSSKSLTNPENPHAVARNNNAIRKFFANLLRAPARLLASVFSKLASLFK